MKGSILQEVTEETEDGPNFPRMPRVYADGSDSVPSVFSCENPEIEPAPAQLCLKNVGVALGPNLAESANTPGETKE
jgi:hypothetical protein